MWNTQGVQGKASDRRARSLVVSGILRIGEQRAFLQRGGDVEPLQKQPSQRCASRLRSSTGGLEEGTHLPTHEGVDRIAGRARFDRDPGLRPRLERQRHFAGGGEDEREVGDFGRSSREASSIFADAAMASIPVAPAVDETAAASQMPAIRIVGTDHRPHLAHFLLHASWLVVWRSSPATAVSHCRVASSRMSIRGRLECQPVQPTRA